MSNNILEKKYNRKFVDNSFEVVDAVSIEPWIESLLEREIKTKEQLEKWLEDYSELESIVDEDFNRKYVAMTIDTKDEEKKDAYLFIVREIQPKLEEWNNKLKLKYYNSPFRKELDKNSYKVLDRMFSTELELFSEKNIPIGVKLSELSQKYQSITGNWIVDFDGKKMTMPQMSKYIQEPDRGIRERAWKSMVDRRVEDADKLELLFDEMLKSRHEFALNLGLKDYREYCFKSKLRDYSSDDCMKFHESIEETVLPLVKRITENRKRSMNIAQLRPWDTVVDPLGREPLKPFDKVDELQRGVEKIFENIDNRFGDMFGVIKSMMDLESRDGKAPGGYQTTFAEKRIPFIFTNAAGVHNDVITLLHEGGHAFHTLLCRDEGLIWYRHSTMEFAEVASMTQELLGSLNYDVFYKEDDELRRARYDQLERVVSIFPWVATIDAFQHWIYTNPAHNREDREKKWLELSDRFDVDIDWSGIDPIIKKSSWHRQLHIFEVPFYYIEYAIAQLGALQIYNNYKKDQNQAVNDYLHALSYGGSLPLNSLFEKANIKFDFSSNCLSTIMETLSNEIEELES